MRSLHRRWQPLPARSALASVPIGSVTPIAKAMTGARLVKGIGLAVSGWGTGMTLAMLGAALLLHVEGWRAVMVAASALDLVVTAGLGWALPPRSRVGGTAARAPRPAPQLREFDTNRALNWMGIINAAGTSITIYVLERSSRRWCSAFWRIASPILPRAGCHSL
jgi:hypothetical protein